MLRNRVSGYMVQDVHTVLLLIRILLGRVYMDIYIYIYIIIDKVKVRVE